jgi:hypothetical protein
VPKTNVVPFSKRENEERESERSTTSVRLNYEREISLQLDAMQEITEQEREKVLQKGWVEDTEAFYNLTAALNPLPSYRPRVQVPQLQADLLREASDLSDVNPIPYIVKVDKEERLERMEKSFQAQWKQSDYNLETLIASLWSMFVGTSYIQTTYDEFGNRGRGEVKNIARHPATVFRDPYHRKDDEIDWVIFEDYIYIDEVRRRWPDHGYRVQHRRPGSINSMDWRLSMPEGPMSMIGGFPTGISNKSSMDQGRVRVRKAFVADYSHRRGGESQVPTMPAPLRRMAYPYGRLIIECEGVVLYDDQNPFKLFPVTTFWGMPPLTSAFAPPPAKWTRDIQDLAERMLTQTFENAVRLNNGTTYVDQGSGIDIDEWGGAPSTIYEVTAGSRYPETKWPDAMPQHMVDLPKVLLDFQKDIQGFTQNRKGSTAAGNISAPLFDASVLMSQSLTRLRAKFLANSFQRLARVTFNTMGKFYVQNRIFPHFDGERYEPIKWDAVGASFDADDYEIHLDEASIRPYSQTSLRMLVPVLKQLGVLPAESALELLDIPNREEIIKQLKAENAQKAQAEQAKQAAKKSAKAAK